MSQLKQRSKNFFCYLLTSLQSEYKHHTYIGYSTDVKHRIKQHNRELGGGARRTEKKQPWQVVLAVSGFSDDISALKFEWAWQKPHQSQFLKHLYPLKGVGGAQTKLKAKVRYLYHLVNVFPWSEANLTIHWFLQKKANNETTSIANTKTAEKVTTSERNTKKAKVVTKQVTASNNEEIYIGDVADYHSLKDGCPAFPRETFTELDNLYDRVCGSCKFTLIKSEINLCEFERCPSKKVKRRLAKMTEEVKVEQKKEENESKVQTTGTKLKVEVMNLEDEIKTKVTKRGASETQTETQPKKKATGEGEGKVKTKRVNKMKVGVKV
eukprot:TRINITY_DN17300_c0_g1_i1.p1 TRINITY_DN17300_c0_g1~~TRINITY_DN17300_c0_g1_i1.p1  ORF type:complete len:324 (-),score=62.86 TRINITY_DN17300_c0_g1_i1:214-1185(-)